MKVKIAYDFEENEYIAFIDNMANISGFGISEKDAIYDLLKEAKKQKIFDEKIITRLLGIINNEN